MITSRGVFDRGGGTNCQALNLVKPGIQKKMTTDMKKLRKN